MSRKHEVSADLYKAIGNALQEVKQEESLIHIYNIVQAYAKREAKPEEMTTSAKG